MKKNTISYTSLTYFLMRASFIGISFQIIANFARQDAWISAVASTIFGILPLLLIIYISSYEPDKTFKEKCKNLFPIIYPFIILITTLGIFYLTIVNFWNLSNLITSQFLNKTPRTIILSIFIIPIILLISKKKQIISRVSLVLFYISILLLLLNVSGLFSKFDFSNLSPFMNNQIIPASYSYFGFNIGPLILLLTFQNNQIKHGLWNGYIIASISLIINILIIIGVLGINLSVLYQYPEFHILKTAFDGIVSFQLENLLAIQWLFDIFIFCAVSLKFCNENLSLEKNYKYIILPIILLMSSIFIFKDTTTANAFIIDYLSFIIPVFFTIIILLFSIKVFFKKNRKIPI